MAAVTQVRILVPACPFLTPLLIFIFPRFWKIVNLEIFFSYNFEVEAHNFKFTKHVSDEQHPSSVANTNEALVGVI